MRTKGGETMNPETKVLKALLRKLSEEAREFAPFLHQQNLRLSKKYAKGLHYQHDVQFDELPAQDRLMLIELADSIIAKLNETGRKSGLQ